MRSALKDILSSKKALAYLSTILLVIGNKIAGHFGYELDADQVALLVGSAAAYIIGQGMADHGTTAALVNAESIKGLDTIPPDRALVVTGEVNS